jgi:RNA polymerase sigma factor (sigma-70 family)
MGEAGWPFLKENEVPMLEEAVRGRACTDDLIAQTLLTHAAEAHRLAAWILRDPVGAEDAVQEAALVAWNKRASLRDPDSAEGWFSRIVVNVCRDELRRRARKRDLPALEGAADSNAERLAERDELGRAVARLTPDQQLVLGLRYGRDLTVPQIAAQTGISEGTVKSRLHYSLEQLRAALDAERRVQEQTR